MDFRVPWTPTLLGSSRSLLMGLPEGGRGPWYPKILIRILSEIMSKDLHSRKVWVPCGATKSKLGGCQISNSIIKKAFSPMGTAPQCLPMSTFGSLQNFKIADSVRRGGRGLQGTAKYTFGYPWTTPCSGPLIPNFSCPGNVTF